MNYPILGEISTSRDMIREFRGYNHNDVIAPNEFYDMKNMTSSRYPILSPRNKRGMFEGNGKPNGLFFKDYLYWVNGTLFSGINGPVQDVQFSVADSPKQFVSMGAYLLIWPDKKFYNTTTHGFGDLENVWISALSSVNFTLAKLNPETQVTEDYTDAYIISNTAPENPEDGTLWYDTSTYPNVLKIWSESSKMWNSIATTYVKISSAGIGNGFKKYDGVRITGSLNDSFNNTFVLYDVGADYITIEGSLLHSFSQTGFLTVKREIPDMDFITECDNRLWGCSSANHEIYACKLGDPFNWNCFEGISTDSYSATIGSDGDFTGAIAHLGNVLFFKENWVHKIYGTKPANFQLSSTNLRGVEKGSEKSMVTVNETLYYKSKNGIVAYQGALPVSISDALGNEIYRNAVAGSAGDKYYISMQNVSDGDWYLFAYDEKKGLWHKEDHTHVLYFALAGNSLYFVDDDKKCLCMMEGASEDTIEWYAETGDMGLDSPENKHISKIIIRMEMETGSKFTVDMQFDGGDWTRMFKTATPKLRSFTLPIIPRRCDHFRIRLSGKGMVKIYSISKVIEDGSKL